VDYPLLNLLVGLGLVLANTLSAVLARQVARAWPASQPARLSALALALSLLLSLYVGFVLLQQMLPAQRGQFALWAAVIIALGALAALRLAPRPLSDKTVRLLFELQLLSSVASVALALTLLRSLVPLAP
jgi:hypothetical protein